MKSDNYLEFGERGSQPYLMKALDIFSDVLVYIEKQVRPFIEDKIAPIVTKDDIQWIITVPAIWSVSARSFMRKAAKKVSPTYN